MPLAKVRNLCHPQCPHNTEPAPSVRTHQYTKERLPDQSPERMAWEARRDPIRPRVYEAELEARGMATRVKVPGRADKFIDVKLDGHNDAMVTVGAGGRYVIPSAASKPGENFIVVGVDFVDYITHNYGHLWCLQTEAMREADEAEASQTAVREHQRVRAEAEKMAHEARLQKISIIRDLGVAINADAADAEIDVAWGRAPVATGPPRA